MAIRSQAQQQCREGSETRTYDLQLISCQKVMKFHECLTAPNVADNIVRHSVKMRRVKNKESL